MDQFLLEFLKAISSPILWAIKQGFYWILDVLLGDISPESYAALSNFVPDINQSGSSLSLILEYLSFVNSWIPLDIAFFCLSTYFTFLVEMITIKLVIEIFVERLG